jgi:hypothetical protein
MKKIFFPIMFALFFWQCDIKTNRPEQAVNILFVDVYSDNFVYDYRENTFETEHSAKICKGDSSQIYEVNFDTGLIYAEVWLDNELAGATPLIVDLKGGEYDLEIRTESCYPYRQTICVDEENKNFVFTLEEIPNVNVYFHSSPEEIEISLNIDCKFDDGNLTPFNVDLWAGTYTMYACKDGYFSKSELIEITDKTQEIFVSLDKKENP